MDNKLKIINCLGKNIGGRFTMNELSKTIEVPYATFHRTIQGMRDLVSAENVGKAKTISLNKDNPAIRAYLTISSDEERKEFLEKHPIIRNLASELDTKDIVILFGSYAKGSERDSSDIDLMIINKEGNRSISFLKYETIFKKHINPIFITRKEFIGMLKEKDENVGKQALKGHVILNNPEDFWGCVLHG